MSAQITNYKCPACTGPLHFVGESGKLECDYCGSQFDVAEIEARVSEQEKKAEDAFQKAEEKRTAPKESDWDTSGMSSDWGEDADGMRAYSCPSCGAELICDETTAATSCPYCGNPTIVPGQFGGALKPDYIIPFKLNKEAAVAALKKHYSGKFLLPKAFKAQNHIEEIKGLYVPFWLFDAETDANCTFHATRSHAHVQGEYRVVVTDHFTARRAGTISFHRIPADGSSKMPDDYMDSIEPFHYEEMKPFSTAYLPGFLADKYDVNAEASSQRADLRCSNSAVDVLRQDVKGYEMVNLSDSNVNIRRGKVSYALMPVWTLLTKWNGKDYLFMMNGQTGKLIGDLPIHKGKLWGSFLAIAAVLSGVFIATNLGSIIASAIFS